MMDRMYAPNPKCHDTDYIDFLIASPKAFCCTEAAAVQPESPDAPAHDAFTRLLHRIEPDPSTLWEEARPMVRKEGGMLVLDDSTLDKFHAEKIELVSRHWSGKHKRVVRGINLITTAWTDGDTVVPCDYRVYDKAKDGLTKNDHFLAMLRQAKARGFEPQCVAFDSWYSSLGNLKAVRACGWTFLTQLKVNRKVDLDRQGYRAVAGLAIAPEGTIVHLEGFGSIRVFKVVSQGGDVEYWATNDLAMGELTRLAHAERCWAIENYHRGLKQCCGVERAQVRAARAQRNHIGLSIRAFLRLEHHFYTTGVSWYEAKARIIRGAVRAYIANPMYNLT
ncbi:IS701 family transposase (plasmid) [Tundrisphaera lichenicola]|uniref:IS701 family transposase n=1 Tax=Tundrisphaera lichenicola TaxID=2029860 RepID=UPI003EB79552